ncbi:MAG: UvrD-helicase domain-containing protein, partial [Firmicutes bacterium]|nr:UvrD-helicase domain-containing protein [Bacillota bacterium]
MDILNGLNEQQKKAVTADSLHTLVVAGAGSGKTKVLVSRLAWLMQEKNISAGNIMAMTFTNKAAEEMKERVASLTGINTRWMWIGTFHSLCCRLLRMEAQSFGIPGDFIIYDDVDSRAVIKRCLADLGLGGKEKEYSPAAVLTQISRAKNELIDPEQLYADASDTWTQNIARIYRRYQDTMEEAHAMDFDDLLVNAV